MQMSLPSHIESIGSQKNLMGVSFGLLTQVDKIKIEISLFK